MAPLDIRLDELIAQVDRDLPDEDAVAKVGEARRRARELGDLGDQLIDAFVQRARVAGASWSQIGDAMGVSKQAAQQRGAPTTLSRFTDRARRIVATGQAEARDLRHPAVEPEHILAVVLDATDGMAAKIVQTQGKDPAGLAAAIRATLPERGDGEPREHVPFSPMSKRLLEETQQSALDLGHNYIGTEHVLLGVLRLTDSPAARVLVDAGIDHARARDLVAAALMGYQAGKRRATGG
jgi:ClpA/ClpB-like protein